MYRKLGLSLFIVIAAGALVWSLRDGGRDVAAENGAASGTAKIVVDEPIFDFGTIDVGETQRHAFVVKNEGTAPLTLKLQSTSCKCTLAQIGDAVVQPGESTKVELEWKGEHRQESFRQGARLSTNDPQSTGFDLAVEGRIRTKFGIWPETVHFGDIDRNERHELDHIAIFSQVYPDLKIKSLTTTNPDAQVEFVEMPADMNLPEKSQFSRALKLQYRAGTKPGPVDGSVRVVCEAPAADGKPARELTLEFPFTGTVVGDVFLHGRDVVGKAVILGTVPQGTGKKHTVYVHVRNGVAEGLDLSLGRVKPEFMQVRLGERQKLSEKLSRYPVELEIPPGSPEINMINVEPGEVQLSTTNPDYPTIKFDVSVAVVR